MITFINAFRKAIEPCWSVDTASHSELFPNDYAIPSSGGQGVVTSALLLEELRAAFPHERLRLTVGAVYAGQVAVLSHHTYVTRHPLLGRAPTIIDVTIDQAPGIDEKVIFKDLEELITSRGLTYLAFNQHGIPPRDICEDVRSNAPERLAILRERMKGWRHRA